MSNCLCNSTNTPKTKGLQFTRLYNREKQATASWHQSRSCMYVSAHFLNITNTNCFVPCKQVNVFVL